MIHLDSKRAKSHGLKITCQVNSVGQTLQLLDVKKMRDAKIDNVDPPPFPIGVRYFCSRGHSRRVAPHRRNRSVLTCTLQKGRPSQEEPICTHMYTVEGSPLVLGTDLYSHVHCRRVAPRIRNRSVLTCTLQKGRPQQEEPICTHMHTVEWSPLVGGTDLYQLSDVTVVGDILKQEVMNLK